MFQEKCSCITLKDIKVGYHEFQGITKLLKMFPMISGQRTEKLLSMGIELLRLAYS